MSFTEEYNNENQQYMTQNNNDNNTFYTTENNNSIDLNDTINNDVNFYNIKKYSQEG